MSYIYEEVETDAGSTYIKRTDETGLYSFIPKDEANSDYQTYLASLETPKK